MKERIKELRKSLGLTQQEFSDRIQIDRSTVAGYETGKTNPTNGAISLICREFNVSETWLRTGNGEIFEKISRDDKVADFFGDLMKDEPVSFRRRLINVLSDLDVEQWEALEKVALRLVEEYEETKKADPE